LALGMLVPIWTIQGRWSDVILARGRTSENGKHQSRQQR
jgi:hypothetical protein